MSSKPLDEYTDRELETAIKIHETELHKDKNAFFKTKQHLTVTEIQQLQTTIIQKEEWLKQLLKERKRRKDYDKEDIV